MMPVLLDLGAGRSESLLALVGEASDARADVHASLALAVRIGSHAPLPGSGRTRELWDALASIAAIDLTTARVIEPHLDALAILAEAGESSPEGTWGVFAAEGPGMRVEATPHGSSWVLDGVKPWCSLAGELTNALITAHTSEGRRLFAIDLSDDGITVTPDGWFARGLRDVASGSIELHAVSARPVGDQGWYLARPGFAWGGIGVAAIWFGASVALGRTLFQSILDSEPDQLGLALLGAVDRDLVSCRALLAAAAREVDAGSDAPAVLAQRVRSTVAAAAESILSAVGHALGPAPLVTNEEHARRVADLELYIRQDHAERDLARLGGKLRERGRLPW